MRSFSRGVLGFTLFLALASTAPAAGKYLEVTYPASEKEGELRRGVCRCG